MSRYIHGYDSIEVKRLVRQARTLAPWTMAGVVFPRGGLVMEVGCGVGAELALLAERQPDLRLIGADLAASQLAAARHELLCRVPLVQASGDRLPVRDGSLDGIFTCWLLEHVPAPAALLADCRRALKVGGALYAREVDNGTFRIWPESPAVEAYMDALNRVQVSFGGDPYAGRRLFALLVEAGFDTIEMSLPACHADASMGAAYRELVAYFRDLLASVRPAVLAAGLAADVADRAIADMTALLESPVGSVVHQPRFARALKRL